MTSAAILGAGPIGSAIAHRLAEHARLGEIRLIDEAGAVAAGKALDIRQAGPIGGYDTAISGATDLLSAAGADVIVFADPVADGEWEGERGLALVQRLVRAGSVGPTRVRRTETDLADGGGRARGRASRSIACSVPPRRRCPTASLPCCTSKPDLRGALVGVTGRPPSFVVAWSSATIGGRLVTDVVPAHRLLSISQSLAKLWPPGPQAIAAPTAAVVEGLINGSRAPITAAVITDGEFGGQGRRGDDARRAWATSGF